MPGPKNRVRASLSVNNTKQKRGTTRQVCNSAVCSPCSYRTIERNCKKQSECGFDCHFFEFLDYHSKACSAPTRNTRGTWNCTAGEQFSAMFPV